MDAAKMDTLYTKAEASKDSATLAKALAVRERTVDKSIDDGFGRLERLLREERERAEARFNTLNSRFLDQAAGKK